MLAATIATTVFTFAMFVLVCASVRYAVITYKQNKEDNKFNVAHQFFRDFKGNYVKDFDEILRADKNTIRVNKAELWVKAKGICKFFSFLGQSLNMGKVDLKNIYTFFYEYLFDQDNLTLFLKQIKLIYSERKWGNSEMLLSFYRDGFNYLINEIGKTDPEYQEYKDLVRKNVNVIYKKYLFGSLIFKGSLSIKRNNFWKVLFFRMFKINNRRK